MEKKEIEVNEAQVESAINEAVAKMFKGNDIDKEFLDKIVRCGLYEIMFGVLTLHNLPKKAFIDCSSPKDADILIEIGYTKDSATSFYIGNVSDGLLAAQLKVMKHMDEHNILFYYISPYRTSYFMDGHCFDSENVYMERLKEK